jgi:transposase
MNSSDITKMLNLPNLTILSDCEDGQGCIHVTAESNVLPPACPHCGAIGEMVGVGRKQQSYVDFRIREMPTIIHIQRRRLQCKACKKTFNDFLPDMDEKRSMTRRLVERIKVESLNRPFVDVAKDYGINDKTVRNIFHDYVSALDATRKYETPDVLGIDEVYLMREFRCVIVDVRKSAIMDLLEKRTKAHVIVALTKLPDKDRIKVVTMDMHVPYRDAVAACLPNAVCVADKFHVQRMVNFALDDYRKQFRTGLDPKLRKTLMHDRFVLLKRKRDLDEKELLKLDTWILNFPTLGRAYELKEQFYDVWEAKTASDAWDRYMAWWASVPLELKPTFAEMNKTIHAWKREIFNYFDHPYTNAVVESLNRNIKDKNRDGRGYSFDVLRAKMLYGSKDSRPTRGKGWKTMTVAPRFEPTAVCEFIQNSLDSIRIDETGQTSINIEEDED